MADVMTRLALASVLSFVSACSANSSNGADQNQYSGAGGGGNVGGSGPSGTGATPGTGNTGNTGSTVTGVLPCGVEAVVKSRCQTCHGPTPLGGAPMSLVTESDFQQDYTVHTTTGMMGQTIKLYQLAKIRINGANGTMKMPQGNPLSPSDFTTFDSWLGAGAPPGAACAPPAGGTGGGFNGGSGAPGSGGYIGTGSIPAQGAGGMIIGTGAGPAVGGAAGAGPGAGGSPPETGGNIITPDTVDQCATDPTQFQPLVPEPGETCYEFPVHGQSSPTDKSKFSVPTGQTYNQWYYNIPWPAGALATRFGAKFDNLKVLHHWLAFAITSGGQSAGTVQTNVTGTTLGQGAELIGGWAVGGCNTTFTKDVGLKLPTTGQIMIQWHHYNSTGAPAPDGTVVQFCTVPAGGRPNVAGITFLGTENFNGLAGMPAGQVSKFSGTCTNNSGKPIHIVGYSPHMHLLGINMASVVKHTDGKMETAFDHPFLFDHQVNYQLKTTYVLQPNESITSTCTFNNTTSAPVAFGQPTQAEMCYQFTIAYPYGALNNGVLSLIGATNTCW